MGGSRPRLAGRGPALLLALGLAMFGSIRLQLHDDEVPNPDISGILYNADGLLRGELPYLDNAEFKPLGSFYAVATIFWVAGRDLDALQGWYAVWLLLGAPAIALAARSHCPEDEDAPTRRMAVALSVCVYLYYVGMFTYNYTSWMVPLYAWAYVGIVLSLQRGSIRWAGLAGACSTLATVTMQRGAVLGPVALIAWALHARTAAPRWRVLGAWIAAAAVGAVVVARPYLLRGGFPDLVRALVPLGLVSDYSHAPGGKWAQTAFALPGLLAQTLGGGLALLGLATLSRWPLKRSVLRAAAGPAVFLAASLAGAGLGGGRFYVHYLVQLVPALAIAVGSPGLVRAWTDPTLPRRRAAFVSASILVLVGCCYAVATGAAHRYESKARRLTGGKSAAWAAGTHIAQRTDPGDSIYGWGWTAWRVYFWADRRAPGRYYKALGRVTTFNSNTAFDAGGDVTFRPGPHAEAFIHDFDADPPAYFVLSPSFTQTFGAKTDPLHGFTALRKRLERDYRPEARYGDLTLLRRRSAASR